MKMHPLRPGDPEKLGAYAISGRLTDGPRGVAYVGKESDDAPLRVVKVLSPAAEADGDDIARLTGAQRVSSSYLARTLDAGRHGDRPYVVREHVEGRSLAEIVAADGPLDADALERVAVGVLTALTAVHLAGITHRGLTPHNVIVGPDGPRVTDIDLGEPVGAVDYRAPEQLRGLAYGPYADVFAWAATVVFAATGQPPFGQDADAVLKGQPEIGNLAEPLRRVVLSALSKDVTQRPTTYMALLQLLGDKRAAAGGVMPQKAAAQPGAPLEGVPVPPPVGAVPGAGAPEAGTPLGGMPVGGAPVPPQQSWGPPEVPQGPGQGVEAAPMEGVPVPPPGGPMWEAPHEQVRQAPLRGETVPPRAPRKFPLGLAAAVGALALLSGAGLWGANQYASTQRFEPVAAAEDPATGGAAAAVEGTENQVPQPAQGQGQPEQGQGEVTVPWAATRDADPNDVGPMVLPNDWTSETPTPPELSTVPTPLPVNTQPVTRPTVTQTAPAQPTVTVTQTPTQAPTPSPTPSSSQVATLGPSESPTPTATGTPAPTVTVTVTPSPAVPTPTVTPTRHGTATPSSPPVTVNPHSPSAVCGPGFFVQRAKEFPGGQVVQLYNRTTGENCVVTMKTADIGKPTRVGATLEVLGGASRTMSGTFGYYAGPVKLYAKGQCVRVSGTVGSSGTTTDWSHCG
ncbi:MAG TPA: hypothetical protein VFV66_06730 [Nonomuraea sp.]|nr:hypothetical protein [Nonomuraea sp.]